ncbi:MAG: hypothetical protein BWY63_03457 [Chloroflexi bacterium ADurb.Bin360]|nr:MAG: hypothetical protein BWY63_03457 [Chloroflexi bacterium ADurb.Bin360]
MHFEPLGALFTINDQLGVSLFSSLQLRCPKRPGGENALGFLSDSLPCRDFKQQFCDMIDVCHMLKRIENNHCLRKLVVFLVSERESPNPLKVIDSPHEE